MDLREYENAKFHLAGILRPLLDETKSLPDKTGDQIRACFVGLAEDRFNLAVVGRFGRGKSSLMNAFIGMERLPTGILPLTSVITTVMYGSSEKVILRYDGRHLPAEIAVDELPDYITQQKNPGNVRNVRTAEVHLPAEILRRGFHFIDTPGLGSAVEANTRTTESFLPEADALLIVTSYDSPLSEEEFAILRMAARYGRRVFMVLNKQDTVTEAQRREGLQYVNEQLRRVLGPHAGSAFSVSARDGLAAKLGDGPHGLESSGLSHLEEELLRFLVDEKLRAFLASFCERILDITRLHPESAAFASAASEIQQFKSSLAPEGGHAGASLSKGANTATGTGSLDGLAPCEICERIQSVSFDFLCRYQYELSVSPEAQIRHAKARGLCVTHARQLAALSAPRGVAVGYPTLLDQLSETLRRSASGARSGVTLVHRDVLSGRADCALCILCEQTLAGVVTEIADRLHEDPQHAVDRLSGICMLHLPDLVAALSDPVLVERVLTRESTILLRLAEDLRRYAMKHDAIRRQLASHEENEAVDRSLKMIAGLDNVHVHEGGD